MSRAPRPCTRPPSIRPGRLSCAGHRVEVAGEQDRRVVAARRARRCRPGRAPARRRRASTSRDVRGGARLVARLRRDVDQLERPRGEPLGEVRHGPHNSRRSRPDLHSEAVEKTRHGRTAQSRYATAAPEPGRAKQRAFVRRRAARGRPRRAQGAAAHRRRRRGRRADPAARPAAPEPLPRPGQGRGAQGAGRARPTPTSSPATTSSARARSATSRRSSACRSSTAPTVILDIFAGHAHSAEGKLQVELAQLEYNLARMRGLWTHLERLGRRHRHARPGRVADRDGPPPRARPHRRAAPPAAHVVLDARDPARRARARAPADRRARRLHERGQVDAAQRAHGRRGRRPRPALPHARPDDAHAAARRPHLPGDRHRRLHPQAARTSSSTPSARRWRRPSCADLLLHVVDAQRARGGARWR